MVVAVALYCRISRDAERQGLGVARQEQDLRALVDRKGWTVADVYVDNDISAARKAGVTRERPRYRAMLDAIREGEVSAVAAWDQDRLVRDPMELEELLVLCEVAGMHRLATVGDEWDIGSGEGIMVARIKAAVAADEVRKLAKRIRRKHLQLAEDGQLSGGGHRPFGYEADRLTVRPVEADLIRDAAARVLAGESVRSIARMWHDQGVATVTGAMWAPTTVRRLLSSGRISGQREHHDEIVSEAVWPAIISPAETARLRRILSDPARFVGGGVVARSYLLTGLVYCGACEARMTTRPIVSRGHRYRRYTCAVDRGGCNRCGISADGAEEEVAGRVLDVVDSPAVSEWMAARENSGDEERLVDAITADREALADLTAARFVDRTIGQAEFLAARRVLEARIAAAEARLAERSSLSVLSPYRPAPGLLGASWPELSFDRRRAIVCAVVDRIVVAPARGTNRFDAGRLDVTWRH